MMTIKYLSVFVTLLFFQGKFFSETLLLTSLRNFRKSNEILKIIQNVNVKSVNSLSLTLKEFACL